MYKTTSTGYFPIAVSEVNMSASALSIIAFVTSDTSALVGVSESTMDSSISVATIVGTPYLCDTSIIFFCVIPTSSMGISTPRSPLATIM